MGLLQDLFSGFKGGVINHKKVVTYEIEMKDILEKIGFNSNNVISVYYNQERKLLSIKTKN